MAVTEKNQLFDPGFLFTPSDTFSLGRTVLPQYKMSQTDDTQTTDRRQTTHRAKGTTDSTVGQKLDFCVTDLKLCKVVLSLKSIQNLLLFFWQHCKVLFR